MVLRHTLILLAMSLYAFLNNNIKDNIKRVVGLCGTLVHHRRLHTCHYGLMGMSMSFPYVSGFLAHCWKIWTRVGRFYCSCELPQPSDGFFRPGSLHQPMSGEHFAGHLPYSPALNWSDLLCGRLLMTSWKHCWSSSWGQGMLLSSCG